MNQRSIEKFHKHFAEIFLLSFFTLYSKSVSAYIDPGTGGMIIGSSGSIIGLILAVIGAILVKYFFNPIKKTIIKIKNFFLKKDKKMLILFLQL
jgi:hypothetical protein